MFASILSLCPKAASHKHWHLGIGHAIIKRCIRKNVYLSGVARGGQRGERSPGATLGGRWNCPDRKNYRPTIWYIFVRDQRMFRISNSFLKKYVSLSLYVFCFVFVLLVTFENDRNLFWVYIWKFSGKKSGDGAPISLLAPGARHPRYAPGVPLYNLKQNIWSVTKFHLLMNKNIINILIITKARICHDGIWTRATRTQAIQDIRWTRQSALQLYAI